MEVMPYYGSGDGGGGAGGKQLRSRRRYAPARTPYDRPLESRRSNSSGRSWFSRIVNPITSGAGKLFSSVFRRPEETSSSSASSSDDDEEDTSSEEQEQEENVLGAVVLKDDVVVESDLQGRETTLASKEKSESKLSEIENLVNSKTFTRDEFIHLTVLLQSRVVDSSDLKEHGQNTSTEHLGNYLRNEALEEAQRWREERRKSQEEGGNSGWDGGLCGNVSSLDLSADVPDNAASSPVDIAKAYMGVRPTWASSPPVALLPYKSTEIGYPRNNLSFVPTTKGFWSASNSQHEDRYRTPMPSRLWNDTQRVTYSPYSRAGLTGTPYYWGAHSQHSIQRTDNAVENDMTFSRLTQIQHSGTGGHEISKRRCSVIDDDQACIGPIRRTRQKSFANVSSFSTPYKESIPKVCGVPTQSSLTAHKLLQNSNEKLSLSSKKPSEEQLVSVKSNNIMNASATPVSLQGTSSVFVSSAISEKTKDSQPNIVEGLENKACENVEGVVTPAIQTSKSLPLASDVGLNCNQNPTFEFGSGNMSKGPIFSFATNGSTNSNAFMPKFDFKFESKKEMLFSAAVEAAVASESSSLSALSSNPISTSQSISDLGVNSNSKPAFSSWTTASFKSMSSSPFSSTLFTGSSSTLFQSTGSPLFSTSVATSYPSLSSFGLSKLGASASAPASFTGLTKTSSQPGTGNFSVFGSSSSSSFDVIPTSGFSSGIAQFGVSITPVSAATAASSSGVHSNSTLAFGSSSSFSLDNSVLFKSKIVPPLYPSMFKTSSTSSFSFGTSSQFGSGGSANGENKQASSLVETVEAATDKTAAETKSSIGCGLGGLASSSRPPTQIFELTSSTSVMNTSIGTTLADGQQTGQMNGNDLREPSKLTGTPLSGSVEQTTLLETTSVDGQKTGQINGNDLKEPSKLSGTPLSGSAEQTSSTVSRTSAALPIDSQSNAESSEAKASIPSQKLSMFGTHTSGGHKEVADNGDEKRSRRIVRVKRDRARKK